MPIDTFHTQNRGGKGIKGMQTLEEDYIEDDESITTAPWITAATAALSAAKPGT